MRHRGFSHIGLSTLDLDKTCAFYEGVLGFKAVDDVTIKIEEGGSLRHLFFDVGGQRISAFPNQAGFPVFPQNTMRGSTAASGFPRPFIILLSRQGRWPRWRRSVTSYATRAQRPPTSLISARP